MPVNGITCTETINGNNVQIAGQILGAKTKNQVALVVSTDVNNVNENNIVHIDQKTSTTGGNFNFNFTLPQNPADVNYGYIIGTDADVDSYIGTISEGQTDDEEPTPPARTVTCTETVDGNNVKISGLISDANSKNQVALVVSTDVNNVNENNIVHIDQTTSTTSGTFAFNFTLPQNSGVSSYGYIIGTDADTETYIGVINIQQGGNEDDDDDDDNDHGGDTDITGTTVTVKYYLGADGVFAQTDIDGTSYLLKNGHGDTVTIVRNGNVVDDAEYDAYGNVENPQNITAYTYANYYYDSHSGMYYLRNRFYDSSIARFISEDPVKDGLNWYAYCSGNPIAFVDPWGLSDVGMREWVESRGGTVTPNQYNFFGISFGLKSITVNLNGTTQTYTSDDYYIKDDRAYIDEFQISDDFGYTTYGVGAAKPYYEVEGGGFLSSPNCYSYAIGKSAYLNPGMYAGIYIDGTKAFSVSDIANLVVLDMEKMGRSARIISGPNAKIMNSERRIALRVGTRPLPDYLGSGYDYHFMVQNSDGSWSEKHGGGSNSINHGIGMNPNNIPWTVDGQPYYDSKIIYIAITN